MDKHKEYESNPNWKYKDSFVICFPGHCVVKLHNTGAQKSDEKTKKTISCSSVGPVSQVRLNLNGIRLIREEDPERSLRPGRPGKTPLHLMCPLSTHLSIKASLSSRVHNPLSSLPHLCFLSFPFHISRSPAERPTENLISLYGKPQGLVFCLIV